MLPHPILLHLESPWVQRHTELLMKTYHHWTGKALFESSGNLQKDAHTLYCAPYVVVSSNAETDPILNYGNEAALRLWEMSWDEFIRTPGRKTAEMEEQA